MNYPSITHLLNDENKPYFEATKDQKLVIQYCSVCHTHQFYPRVFCMNCFSDAVQWVEASGKGKLYSYSVVKKTFIPEYKDKVPYIVALIDLEEGVRLMSHMVDIDEGDLFVGMEVSVVFREQIGEYKLPQFVPAK